MRVLLNPVIWLCALSALVALGEWSGRVPERDAVAAAEAELGLELESRLVDLGEVTLHVVLAGPADGRPVVLLHGFPEFWYAWRGPMAVLARSGFRVIVPDQRGYNASDKPPRVEDYRADRLAGDVAALIRELGHDSAYLASHDWGGAVAWYTAIEHPEQVRRMVVIDTPHPRAGEQFESAEDSVSWYRTFLQIPWLPGWTARLANWRVLAGSLQDSSRPGTFPDEVMDQFRSAWDRDGALHSMAAWYRAELPTPSHDGRVRVPTLLVLAPDDVFIPSDLSRRSLAFVDHGELLELDSGTHWIIQEEPERIGRLLVEYFSADD